MKNNLISFNGSIIEEADASFGIGRAMRFGDGLFESIRIISGVPQFWKEHMKRLAAGLEFLSINFDPLFFDELLVDCHSLINRNEIAMGGILKIIVYRAGQGKYLPESNDLEYIIEAKSLGINQYILNKKGLKIDVCEGLRIHADHINQFKTLNALPYVRASLEAKDRKLDDIILLNDSNYVVEASSSNVWMLKKNCWYTPSLESGALNGIMRYRLKSIINQLGMSIKETTISPKDFKSAEELMLSNSISGVQWVGAFQKQRFFHKEISKIAEELSRIQ